jgi:hypothetical protein
MFQREIQKKWEIRVTVVDQQCFPVRFDCSALPESIVDMRKIDFEKSRSRFERATDVDCIVSWSKKIVAALGIAYAGLDWVLDSQGTPYFLECNPMGSFKWSEMSGRFNISHAIANSLLRRIRA